YPDGFYASLAKGQLSRIEAEEARAAAADKAKQTEDEKARLASERASKAEQDKAAAAADAAETAKFAAEKARQAEEAKTAAAEQRRKEAEAAVAKDLADKQAAEKALADRIVKDKATTELAAKQSAEKARADGEQKLAAVAPTAAESSLSPQETVKLVQSELRRVGCLNAAADDGWNDSSQQSLSLFNKYSGTNLNSKLASYEALDAIRARPGRVCPLVCNRGFKADGNTCVKIACPAGYRVDHDNECQKLQDKKPVATKNGPKWPDEPRKQAESSAAKPQSSGQVVCNSAGCRPVAKGCHLQFRSGIVAGGAANSGGNVEVCN
ncbi:caspase family protein, partial [Bradyrhizobium sp. 62]|nr:caspase family protein [Bradyrhizobium sp. 62]